VARIAVGAERVTWSEFSRFRPHVDSPGLELEFDREAYLSAPKDYEQRHL
jgi:hypothetical protein